MTVPVPLSTDVINSVLLPDGWHPVQQGTLFLFTNPQFADPSGGPPETVGGQWVQFAGTDGITYGCPAGSVQAVQWTPPAPPPPA